MQAGWVKLPREILNNEVIFKDAEYLSVYIFLLLNASYIGGIKVSQGSEKYTLKVGEALLSVREVSWATKIEKMKVHRILKRLRDEKIIDTAKVCGKTLVKINGWEDFSGQGDTENDTELIQKKEKQDEKEKRSKREKEEIKEVKKKVRNTPYNPPREKNYFSSFDTEDFFQVALERSERRIRERSQARINGSG